jgi:hypothetical protein
VIVVVATWEIVRDIGSGDVTVQAGISPRPIDYQHPGCSNGILLPVQKVLHACYEIRSKLHVIIQKERIWGSDQLSGNISLHTLVFRATCNGSYTETMISRGNNDWPWMMESIVSARTAGLFAEQITTVVFIGSFFLAAPRNSRGGLYGR